MRDEQDIKAILEKKYTGSNLGAIHPTYSILFDNLKANQKVYYENLINREELGLPVVLFLNEARQNWIVVGTKGITWSEATYIYYLSPDSIDHLTSNDRDAAVHKAIEQGLDKMVAKYLQEELVIYTKNNTTHILYPTLGYDFYALWHLIMKLCNLNDMKSKHPTKTV